MREDAAGCGSIDVEVEAMGSETISSIVVWKAQRFGLRMFLLFKNDILFLCSNCRTSSGSAWQYGWGPYSYNIGY